MKAKTSELYGVALDWAVAKCEGHEEAFKSFYNDFYEPEEHYSTDWSQGGPIIERIGGFELKIWLDPKEVHPTKCEVHIHNYEGNWIEFGPTPLIAAMRCYVSSKMGDEIEVPDALCTTT